MDGIEEDPCTGLRELGDTERETKQKGMTLYLYSRGWVCGGGRRYDLSSRDLWVDLARLSAFERRGHPAVPG